MIDKRKICVVTGTRADYGLLSLLMNEIKIDPDLELQIIATGMHLSPEFGLTYRVIEEDGFRIDAKIEMLMSSDTPVGIAKSMGLALIGFADALERLNPDILVVLGDRYEIMSASQAAMVARIPIAHLHGGESTEGLVDEAIRHSITKMAHFHFVSAEPYQKKVIQLGEDPKRVFNFGSPGIDNILRLRLLNRVDFEKAINFKLGKTNFLVTYHPVTLNRYGPEQIVCELLKALDNFSDAKIIFTKTNSDTDGRIINQMIDNYVTRHPNRTISFTSLGQLKYLSAISNVDIVIGNSSSGLIEVPVLKKPTINIGDRQLGRLKASSVIDCVDSEEAIVASIKKALSSEFKRLLKTVVSPYGNGNASFRIKEVLKNVDLNNILYKKFFEIEVKG